MKITKKWIKDEIGYYVCFGLIEWFENQDESESIKVIKKLMEEEKFKWANGLIVPLFNYKQNIMYAVYAAEKVLPVCKIQNSNDKYSQEAIEAAKRCIDDPSKENKNLAYAALSDAAEVSYTAATDAAKYAADAATNHFGSAQSAAYSAAYAATYAYSNPETRKQIATEILNYGLSLLEGDNKE